MKFSLPSQQLTAILKQSLRFIASRPQLPVLSCVLLEVAEDTLTISATDLQTGFQKTIPVKNVIPGKVAIPAKLFLDTLEFLHTEVTCELESQHIQITTPDTSAQIAVLPAEDFPEFPSREGKTLHLPLSIFSEILPLVSFSASQDETRPVLTSTLFEFHQQEVKIVATDGFRLATYSLPISQDIAADFNLLFPTKSLMEIARVIQLTPEEKMVALTFSPELKQVFFQSGNSNLVVRTIEGDYPPYQRIIPSSFSHLVQLPASELEQAIKGAMLFSAEQSGVVKMQIEPQQLKVQAQSVQAGKIAKTLPYPLKQGESPLSIAFNGRYLLEFLSHCSTAEIEICCNDSLKPFLLRDPQRADFQYIVMPFRLQE